jgi:putative MATE family efflux protein
MPLYMLMQMMSAGAMGGGISSAVARALGAGRREEAEALALHALAIALVLGLAFTLAALLGGPQLYRRLGGTGEPLAAALAYSNIIFGAAILPWLMNSLASVLRGTGNMAVSAGALIAAALGSIMLAPPLMFGIGPLPALGIAGAAVALAICWGLTAGYFAWYLLTGRGGLTLRLTSIRLNPHRLIEILRVGLPAVIHAGLVNLSVIAMTGYVGRFGTAELAGYGLGARLEYLQIPIVFGFGVALVAMIGANVGAGKLARARRIALTGGLLGCAMTGAVGAVVAVAPELWTALFSDDPAVRAAGALYLQRAGLAYGFLGLGMTLYFASQGAGNMLWPLTAGATRLAVLAGGGFVAIEVMEGTLESLFLVVAAGLVLFGLINLAGALAIFRVPRG